MSDFFTAKWFWCWSSKSSFLYVLKQWKYELQLYYIPTADSNISKGEGLWVF